MSISSALRTSYRGVYSASKAKMAIINDMQRFGLEPFGIRAIDIETGSVESNFGSDRTHAPQHILDDTLY